MHTKYYVTLVGSVLGLIIYFSVASRQHTPPPVAAADSIHKDTHALTAPYVFFDQNPHLQKLLTEYESFLRTSLRNGLAPGIAVAIVRDTSIIYLKGLGLRDQNQQDSVDIHSVFRIASVSKCFASMLTGILVDENRLAWDDPVIKYLPSFKLKSEEHTQGVTLRHVLSHTTGLPYHAFTDRVDEGANFDTLVYHLRDLELFGKPGQFYSYQNVGYSLIGKVIQAATGKTYEENLREKIFVPLQMQSASASYQDIITNPNAAKPHRYAKKWTSMPISSTYYDAAPAGGINASISDMARWLLSLTIDPPRILKKETEAEIFQPFVRATSRNYNFRRWKPLRSAFYALGWRVLNFKDDTLDYHGGYVNGYRSEVAIHRKDKISICVLVNAPGSLADLSVPKFFELYSRHREAIGLWEKQKIQVVAATYP